MSGGGRQFDPEELRGGDGPAATDPEVGHAWAMARELESLEASASHPVDPAFVSRVMAAIEHEPVPQPVAAAGKAVREGRLVGVLASLRDAWRVAFGPGRTFVARAGALAYVLVAFVILGSLTGVAVVGTAALLAPGSSATPAATVPVLGPDGSTAPGTPGPSRAPQPGASATPGLSAQPQASNGPDESATPGSSPSPSSSPDDHGGSPTPTSGAGSSPDDNRTPRPSSSPTSSPSGSPKPTSSGGGEETAKPSASPG